MNKIITLNRSALGIASRCAWWHFSHYILRRDLPLIATFQLTNRCNFNCRMCNIKNNPKQETLPFDLFRDVIEELSRLGTAYVTLSGGEPLLIKGILDYVTFAKTRIPFVNMVTNGYLLSGETAAGIARSRLDSLSVSIDALERNHDAIRGVPGAFKQAMEGIALVRKYSPRTIITVNTVISAWNLEDIKELTQTVGALGLRQKFQPVYVHPEFSGQQASYRAPERDIDTARVKEVVAFLMEQKHVANSRYYLSCVPDYFLGRYDKAIFRRDCNYPSFSLEFTQDGKMYPCLVGKDWQNGYHAAAGIKNVIRGRQYLDEVKRLKNCRLCRGNFSVCYAETRLTLPVTNFLRYNLKNTK